MIDGEDTMKSWEEEFNRKGSWMFIILGMLIIIGGIVGVIISKNWAYCSIVVMGLIPVLVPIVMYRGLPK